MHSAASTFATIFGPMLVIMGLWTLIRKESAKKVVDSFKKTPGLLYLGGIINLVIGLTILTTFSPHWNNALDILITLFGGLFFLRGLVIFFFPTLFLKMTHIKGHGLAYFGIFSIVWGVALIWLALI